MKTNKCHKCDNPIEPDEEGYVHSLCEECENAFLIWFEAELGRLE